MAGLGLRQHEILSAAIEEPITTLREAEGLLAMAIWFLQPDGEEGEALGRVHDFLRRSQPAT
jgi:hypothetical protein